MCSADLWWWLTFLAILLAGGFGGLARFFWEKTEGNGHQGCFAFIVMGIASGFMVPLFLNTISSTLIKDIPGDTSKMFVVIGFCLAAGAFAKQFIGSVAKKALELSQQASITAQEAKQVAASAEIDAKRADSRAIALYKVVRLADEGKFPAALKEVNNVLDDDPDNAEAWAWQGYCLKHTGNVSDAVLSIEKALALEGKDVRSWLFNLACYKCIADASPVDVIAILKRLMAISNHQQLVHLKFDLQNDEDFVRLRTNQEFNNFIESIT